MRYKIEEIIFILYMFLLLLVDKCITILKLPIRWTVCRAKGHDWRFIGGGFISFLPFDLPPFECKRCNFKTDDPE